MTHIYLVRHGETSWNAIRRIQGYANSDLSDKGIEQAESLRRRFSDINLCAVYSSDLTRARDTALPIADAKGLQLTQLQDLREKCFGAWEGLTPSEVADRFPALWHQYHTLRDIATQIPGGETWQEVQARVTRSLRLIAEQHSGDNDHVLIVAHGGSLRVAILDAIQAPLLSLAKLSISNCGVSLIDHNPGRGSRIIYLNDTCHLQDLQ